MSKNKRRTPVQPPRPAIRPMDYVLSAIPAIFLAGNRTFAGPCIHEDGSTPGCATTGSVLFALSIVGIVLVFLRLQAADLRTKRAFDLFLTITGILIAVSPGTVLSLCPDATMTCHTMMLPFARIMGGLLVACALVCEFGIDHQAPSTRRRRR